jgi:hypothetical protein
VAGAAGTGGASEGTSAGGAGTSPGGAGTLAGGAGAPSTMGTGFGPYGSDTPGGKGGALIRVTTLNATGPGSIAEALATAGPRLIVFEVGGAIDLAKTRLDVREPFVTIAGQTAPSPGISFLRGGMRISTHDVVISHVRFRMGDAGAAPASGFEPDVATDGAQAHDVLFDHVSVAWGVDENLSVSGPRLDGPEATSRRVTIRNSIIAEGLKNSVHEKGAHSMGTLIHDFCTDIAVIGNLYAHNDERNPWFKGFATGVIVNNVVYNPGKWAMRLGPVDSEWTSAGYLPEGPRVSIVGNVMKHGVNTPSTLAMVGTNSRGSAFLEDNVATLASGDAASQVSDTVTVLAEKPAWVDGLEAMPAGAVVAHVTEHAGARPKDRDAVDARIIADFLGGTGSIIDSQTAVGDYPVMAATARPLDIPSDVDAYLSRLAAELE